MKRALVPLLLALTACSQGGANVVPSAHAPAGADHRVLARLRIAVPAHRNHLRGAHYVSPATASLAYSIDGKTQTPVTIAASNPDCSKVNSAGALACTVNLSLAPGTHSFSFTAKDGDGIALSANTDVSYDVKSGAANQIPVTLGGIAASLAVLPPDSPRVAGTQFSGFTIYGNFQVAFDVVPVDADGNYIVGPGAPQPFASPAPTDVTVSPAPSSAPNAIGLKSTYSATDPRVSASSTLTVEATPVPHSTGSTVTATVPLTLYQPWIYVADNSAGAVLAFDEQGNAKTLPTPIVDAEEPTGIAYDAHDGWLYVTSAEEGAVAAYDPLGNAQTTGGGFPGLTSPEDVAVDPATNQLYIVDYALNVVNAYDEQGNAVALPAQAFASPPPASSYALARDPNKDWFYVANCTPAAVQAYDASGTTQTLTGSSPFSGLTHPDGITFDTHNDWFYVASCGTAQGAENGFVTAYDEQGNKQTLAGNPSGINTTWGDLYDPYDGLIYVAHDEGAAPMMQVFDEAGHAVSVTGAFTGLEWPAHIAVVP